MLIQLPEWRKLCQWLQLEILKNYTQHTIAMSTLKVTLVVSSSVNSKDINFHKRPC